MKDILDKIYEDTEGSSAVCDYSERHGIESAAVLTVFDEETAGLLAEHLAPRIEGKTIVEIGGGIGLLALHLGLVAKRVYCIEANPMWSWVFAGTLLKLKPKNGVPFRCRRRVSWGNSRRRGTLLYPLGSCRYDRRGIAICARCYRRVRRADRH